MGDLLQDCNNQGTPPKDFDEIFCRRCQNADCSRAAWGDSSFARRAATQADRLLRPTQADPALSKYAPIVRAVFKDMAQRAMQLEIADRKGDWEIPEIPEGPVINGGVEINSPAIVDAAIRSLQGREPPEPEPELQEPEPELAPQEPQPHQPHQVPPPKLRNVPSPPRGVMVGGGPAPKPQKVQEEDPWAPPEVPIAQKVSVGATVRMGGSDD